MPNKDEIIAEMDQQYKKAYFSLFKKKFNAKLDKADTLLTDKKKFSKSGDKSEVKKIKWVEFAWHLTKIYGWLSLSLIEFGALIENKNVN